MNIEHSETDSSCSIQSSASENELDPNQLEDDLSDGWTAINIETDTPAPSACFEFTANSHINEQITSFTKPYQFFNYFFNDELVQNIVDQTNLYYVQALKERPSTSSNKWRTSISEMRTFFAITMAMSIVQKPEEKLYWSKKHSMFTPFFAKMMSSKKYSLIKKFLNFSNNETYDPATHPQPELNKIWPVYLHLNNKFQEAYIPQQHITIDDNIMIYKGRFGWVQYIPMKRARSGMKTYFLCEGKSGYIWSLFIYTGKGTINSNPQYTDFPMSTQVVMNLMTPLLNKGYCLTINNSYSSVDLADFLVSHSTDMYGTVKSRRKGNPKHLIVPKKVSQGFISAYRKGKVMIIRWKDKQDVLFLSTIHGTDSVEITKSNTRIKKLKVAIDYNMTMGGVDREDQHLSNSPVARKHGKKFYMKIFFHLMEQALWNAFVLYTKQVGSISSLEFRLQLIDEYIETYHNPEYSSKGVRPSKTPNPLRLTERHFLEPIPSTVKKATPTKRCAVCCSKQSVTGKRIRRESRYYCRDCNVGLCLTPCFKIYHTKLNF